MKNEMSGYIENLRKTVNSFYDIFRFVEEKLTAVRPAPDKWSAKELLGHLIDSATNNHRRFVLAAYQDEFIFDGYNQEEWVKIQAYQDASWMFLLNFWRDYNLRLAQLMELIPLDVRQKLRHPHNLDQIAWQTVSADQATTLEYFMIDYVGHLQHHLRQIETILKNDE